MTTHDTSPFDSAEQRLRQELRQQAEAIHVSAATREHFRKLATQLPRDAALAIAGRQGLLERLRTFWHGETTIPVPVATLIFALMVTSLVFASGIGTQEDGSPWHRNGDLLIEQPESPAEQPSGSPARGDGGQPITQSMKWWIDPLW